MAAGQEPGQLGLARLDRLIAQIAAVNLDEIEGAVDRRIVPRALASASSDCRRRINATKLGWLDELFIALVADGGKLAA